MLGSQIHPKRGTYIHCEQLSASYGCDDYNFLVISEEKGQEPAHLVQLFKDQIWNYSVANGSLGKMDSGFGYGLGTIQVRVLDEKDIPERWHQFREKWLNQSSDSSLINTTKNPENVSCAPVRRWFDFRNFLHKK